MTVKIARKTISAAPQNLESKSLAVAPMMGKTDRHFRTLIRLMSTHVTLYTEMIPAGAAARGRLDWNRDHRTVVQLGGSHPKELALATHVAVRHGFNTINLNLGCPSPRVESGGFGACLLKTPRRAARCLKAMVEAAQGKADIEAKIRLGVVESRTELKAFDPEAQVTRLFDVVDQLQSAGASLLVIHARLAVLGKFSPAQNRDIPPLMPALVDKVRAQFPSLPILYNGGVTTLAQAAQYWKRFDGVMLGRAVARNPMLLAHADGFFDKNHQPQARSLILRRYAGYVAQLPQTEQHRALRHSLQLWHGMVGARRARHVLGQLGATAQDLLDLAG